MRPRSPNQIRTPRQNLIPRKEELLMPLDQVLGKKRGGDALPGGTSAILRDGLSEIIEAKKQEAWSIL